MSYPRIPGMDHPALDSQYLQQREDLIRQYGFASQVATLPSPDVFSPLQSIIYTTGLAGRHNLELIGSINTHDASVLAPAINATVLTLRENGDLKDLDTIVGMDEPFMLVEVPHDSSHYRNARAHMPSANERAGDDALFDIFQIVTLDSKGMWPFERRWNPSESNLFFDRNKYLDANGNPLIEGMRS